MSWKEGATGVVVADEGMSAAFMTWLGGGGSGKMAGVEVSVVMTVTETAVIFEA